MRYFSLRTSRSGDAAQCSELGFGCAAIGGRVSKKDSLAALGAAYERGLTLYDTARSYGYGESEGVVGEFLRGRRESVVLCTKFGILPARAGGWKQRLKPAARAAVKMFPGLRKAVRRQAGDQFLDGQFSVEVLRESFETSLRELKTDYVDMLLLHAAPAAVLEQDELMAALERLVESGKVRMAGISGDHAVMEAYFAKRPKMLTTAQFAMNPSSLGFAEKTRANSDLLLVANHPFGGPAGAAGLRSRIAELRLSAELPETLREKLDASDSQLQPEIVLNCILRGTGISAVVPAMMQVRHIESNVKAVEACRFTPEELDRLRAAFGRGPAV